MSLSTFNEKYIYYIVNYKSVKHDLFDQSAKISYFDMYFKQYYVAWMERNLQERVIRTF